MEVAWNRVSLHLPPTYVIVWIVEEDRVIRMGYYKGPGAIPSEWFGRMTSDMGYSPIPEPTHWAYIDNPTNLPRVDCPETLNVKITSQPAVNRIMRCVRIKGHEGTHVDGDFYWSIPEGSK